jgi:hypothetical protein
MGQYFAFPAYHFLFIAISPLVQSERRLFFWDIVQYD